MLSLTRVVRLLLLTLAILFGFSAVPTAFAQDDLPEERTNRADRYRRGPAFARGDFRGLTPEESQEAQDLLAEGKAYEEQGRDSAALGRYKRVFRRYPRSSAAPEAYFRTAQIQLKRGKLTRAFDAIDAIVRAYPDYGGFNELISEQYRIAYSMIKDKPGKFLGVLPGFANREKGIEFFERLVLNAPYSDYAPLALMNVAETYLDMGELEAAIFTLDRLITNYPHSIVTSDGYLRMAEVHEKLVDGPLYDQGATQEAMNHYEDFLILFPRDRNVEQAEEGLARTKEMMAQSRMKIGDFYYFKRANYTAAKVFYNEAITIAPASEIEAVARERIARLEVDEAQAEARKLADAGKPERNGFMGLFRRARQIEPIIPQDPTLQPAPSAGGERPVPSTQAEP